MKVKIKKLHEDAQIPKLSTEGSACSDLVATKIHLYPSKKHVTVYSGLAMEIPKGYKLCVVPRSSLCYKGWVIANSPCQIDSDYRGEIIIKFQSISDDFDSDGFPYKALDRFAQCYLEKVIDFEYEEVEELNETERGSGCFGSTGKNQIKIKMNNTEDKINENMRIVKEAEEFIDSPEANEKLKESQVEYEDLSEEIKVIKSKVGVASMMLMSIGLPVTPDILEVIIEVLGLASKKGNKATMEDLEEIVSRHLPQEKEQTDESTTGEPGL